MTAATINETRSRSSGPATPNRLCHFISELRRRRVCRAVTMYSVTLWLVCQVVDVIMPALELPEWTLKLVVVLGLLGLPVIILTSWLFDITPDGLVVEGPGDGCQSRRSAPGTTRFADRLIDCSLIIAALVIGVQLALVAFDQGIEAAEPMSEKIAVAPFRAVTGVDASSVSSGLMIDLQHALIRQLGITVIDSSDPRQLKGSKRLTGAVSTTETAVRVAVTMTDFDSGVVAWSAVIEQPRVETLGVTADLAQVIADELPVHDKMPAPEIATFASQ